jgi:hypothetical protein
MTKPSDNIDLLCQKCGGQVRFVTSLLDSKSGKTYRIYRCDCGEQNWRG